MGSASKDDLDDCRLPEESELDLIKCLQTTEWGKCASREDVCFVVKSYVQLNKSKNTKIRQYLNDTWGFLNDYPSIKWVDNFLKRHDVTLQSDLKHKEVFNHQNESEVESYQIETDVLANQNESELVSNEEETEGISNQKENEDVTNEKDNEIVTRKKESEGVAGQKENKGRNVTNDNDTKLRASKQKVLQPRKSVGDGTVYTFSMKKYERLQKSIKPNKYYAVYYGSKVHYIGYVMSIQSKGATMKFLRKKPATNQYYWPNEDDIDENVDMKYIFLGPIDIKGEPPYKISGLGEATKDFLSACTEL